MKIGLDLDEVTVEFLDSLLKFYNLKLGKNHNINEFETYKFWEIWGGTREEAIKIVDEFYYSPHFDSILPVENAVASINELLKNNEIIIITARPSFFREKTESWLKKHFKLPFEIVFSEDFNNSASRGSSSKAEICKSLNIRLMIEDNKDYALDCANSGIKVILFNKPWNQNLNHENIIRVNGWQEVLKAIHSINNP